MSRQRYEGDGRLRGKWRARGGGRGQGAEHKVDDANRLVIRCPDVYHGGVEALDPPRVMGSFSVDSEKNIHFDDSMLAVLSSNYIPRDGAPVQVDLDLSKGWEQVSVYTMSTADKFEQFLQWILENQRELTAEGSSNKLMADIVCISGVLKTIMHAPFTRFEECKMVILAQWFKGSMYMVYQYEENEEAKVKEKSNLIEIYGHKFEQYMTGGDPDEALDCNCQYRCVLNLHLSGLSLLYPTVMDAVDQTSDQHNIRNLTNFVGLKCYKEHLEPYKKDIFKKYTHSKWWTECQLSGVRRLLTGIRNLDGVVHTLQMLQAADLPDGEDGKWKPSVCINFFVKFLDFAMEKVASEPHRVHRFERSSSDINNIYHSHETRVTNILPEWYRKQLFVSQE